MADKGQTPQSTSATMGNVGEYQPPGTFWPELQSMYGTLLDHVQKDARSKQSERNLRLGEIAAVKARQLELLFAKDARIQELELQLAAEMERAEGDRAQLQRALDKLKAAENPVQVAQLRSSLALSEDQRRKLRIENDHLQLELMAVRAQVAAMEQHHNHGAQQSARLEAELRQAQGNLQKKVEMLREKTDEVGTLSLLVSHLQEELQATEVRLEETRLEGQRKAEDMGVALRSSAAELEVTNEKLAAVNRQLKEKDAMLEQLRAELEEMRRKLFGLEQAHGTLQQEAKVLRDDLKATRIMLQGKDLQLQADRANLAEQSTTMTIQEEKIKKLQEMAQRLRTDLAEYQQTAETATKENEKLKAQRVEDQKHMDKLRALNQQIRVESGTANKAAEKALRNFFLTQSCDLIKAHSNKLMMLRAYHGWREWTARRRHQHALQGLAKLCGLQVQNHRRHVAYLKLQMFALSRRHAKNAGMTALLEIKAELERLLREEVESRNALLLQEMEAFKELHAQERYARHQLRLIAAQKRMLKEFLADLSTRYPETIDMDILYEYTVKRCGAMLPGFAIYIGIHDKPSACLRYQHISDSCSPEMRTGSCKLNLQQHSAVSHCITAHRLLHIPNVHQPPGAGLVTTITTRPVTAGDFYVNPLVLNDGEVPAVLCCDTCQGNRVTVPPENVPLDGVDGKGVRHITDYQLEFFGKVCAILAQRAVGIETAEFGNLRRMGRDPFSFKPLDLYDEAVRLIHERAGRESNAYISVLDTFQLHTTVVAQCCQEGSRHTNMLGKYLSANRGNPGVTFDFCKKRHKTDPQRDNYHLFPNESLDDHIMPYVQRWGAPPNGEIPAKYSDCLLMLGLRSGSNMVMGVVGVEAPTLTKAQVQAIRRIVDVVNGYGPSLVRHHLMSQVGKQCLEWIRFNTQLDYGYLSLTDHFSNFRVLVTTRHCAPLKGLGLAWSDGVSAQCLLAGQQLYIPSVQNAIREGPLRPRFFRKTMEHSDGQMLMCPIVLGTREEVTGERVKIGAIICFDTIGVRQGQKLEMDLKDQAVIVQATEILEEIFFEIMEDETFLGHSETPLKLEELVGTTHVRFLKRVFMHANQEILQLNNESIMEIARYNVPPSAVVTVMYALLHLLGKVDSRQPAWRELRNFVKMDVLRQVQAFDPTAIGERKRFLRSKQALVGFTDEKQVGGQASVPIARFYEWTNVAIMLWVASGHIRQMHQSGELFTQRGESEIVEELDLQEMTAGLQDT